MLLGACEQCPLDLGCWRLQCSHTCRLDAQIEDGGGSCGRAGALPRRLSLATELHEGASSEPELPAVPAGPAFASCLSTLAGVNNKMP